MLAIESAKVDQQDCGADPIIEYPNPTAHKMMAFSRLPVKDKTRDGAVNMPVPTSLLTIKANTSKEVRAPATAVWPAAASYSISCRVPFRIPGNGRCESARDVV